MLYRPYKVLNFHLILVIYKYSGRFHYAIQRMPRKRYKNPELYAMFDASKFVVPSPMHRLREKLTEMMHPDTYSKLCLKVVGKVLVIGLKGDQGRACTVMEEADFLPGPYSLCTYPVSGKVVFDSLKATGWCPQNDSGGPIIGLTESGVLEQILLDLFGD